VYESAGLALKCAYNEELKLFMELLSKEGYNRVTNYQKQVRLWNKCLNRVRDLRGSDRLLGFWKDAMRENKGELYFLIYD
jgi:hypothetical protein